MIEMWHFIAERAGAGAGRVSGGDSSSVEGAGGQRRRDRLLEEYVTELGGDLD